MLRLTPHHIYPTLAFQFTLIYNFKMASFPTFYTFVTLALALGAVAAIGPVTDLTISNGDISPDGYTRAAVLAAGSFPGPLISGNKVSHSECCSV